MGRYFKRIRLSSVRATLRWRQAMEQRADDLDTRQAETVDRYAETVRLHLAYLDDLSRDQGVDFRADFTEFMLQHRRTE